MNWTKPVIFTSPDTWSQLRVLFESGSYPNLLALYDAHKDQYPDMPQMQTLRLHAEEECWDKDRFTEVKTEVRRRNMIELYAELGMDEKEQARCRIECVRAVDGVKEIIKGLYALLRGMDPESNTFNETLSKIKVLTDTMFKGMNTSLAALQDISKLTGSYAPVTTKEVKSHGYGSGDKTIEDMTEEEIIQDIKRMQAAGIFIPEIASDERKQGNEP